MTNLKQPQWLEATDTGQDWIFLRESFFLDFLDICVPIQEISGIF